MKDKEALITINKIFNNIFNKDNSYTLDELLEKFAFDIKLPKKVYDSTTNEETWADSINNSRFITLNNMEKINATKGWLLPKKDITSLEELIKIWESINYTTTERISNSLNVSKSDTIYGCENVYRSTDCSNSKNIIYCDSCGESEFLLACQRTGTSNFCIRTDDSKNCSNSYNVIWSDKISNSFFIQDCFNLHECLFCSHIANQKYCIANMQFTKEEYFNIKEQIINWILNS